MQMTLTRSPIFSRTGLLLALSMQLAGAAEPPPEPQFGISRYEVTGNTLIPTEKVDALMAAHTGAKRRFSDIEAARRALTSAYAKLGFSAVQIELPEQDITAGVVRLQVRELRLGAVKTLNAKHHDVENVRASLPELREGAPPNTLALARSLRMANENPSKQTYLLLKAGQKADEIDAVLRVDDEKPWKVFVTADNTGTPETGRSRLGIGYQHANLFNRDHVGTVQFITSPEQPGDVSILGAGYRIPLYAAADALEFYAGYSAVDSGNVQGLFNVSGRGALFGARYSHPFAKTGAFEHRLSGGLDYRAYRNDIDASGTQVGNDVTVHPLNLAWNVLWRGQGSQASGYANLVQNFPGGDNGGGSDFHAARYGADADYQLFRFGVSASREFAGDWQGRFALDAQLANEPLVPGEQFGIGGQDSVRGFGEREVSGDRGWRAGLELYSPDLGPATGIENARLRLSAFVEGGRVRRIQPQLGELVAEGIASAGLGMRFGVGKALSARLDYGHVLDGGGDTGKNHGRWHGSVAYAF